MILTCPACQTSYTVKDGAVPVQGRTVRCAACKHSWHQPGEEVAVTPPPIAEPEAALADDTHFSDTGTGAPAVSDPEDAPSLAGDTVSIPAGVPDGDEGAMAEPISTSEAVAESEPTAVAEDSGWNDAPYADEDAGPRRKGPLIILALVLFVAVLAAAAYFLAPSEWMARAGLAEASANSPLKLMVTSQDRQHVGDGNDLFSLSGRVINPTDQTELVPPLRAELANGAGKIVYTWTIPPPAARLAPQASASFNAAELGVPANAKYLTLRWAS